MIKLLFNKFGDAALSKWWASLHHPSAFAIRYVCWTSALILLIFAVFAFDVPFKEKTVAELWLGNEVEQYRLHSNTKSLIIAKDEKDQLSDECIELRRRIEALRLARWQLMGVTMPEQKKIIELDMAATELDDLKKKLVVAEFALSKATHLYDELLAMR